MRCDHPAVDSRRHLLAAARGARFTTALTRTHGWRVGVVRSHRRGKRDSSPPLATVLQDIGGSRYHSPLRDSLTVQCSVVLRTKHVRHSRKAAYVTRGDARPLDRLRAHLSGASRVDSLSESFSIIVHDALADELSNVDVRMLLAS